MMRVVIVTFGTFSRRDASMVVQATLRMQRMHKLLDRLFLSHPRAVNETYGQHFMFATAFGVRLVGAGLAALIHAVIPSLFKATASSMIREMHDRITSRANEPSRQFAE